MNRRAFLAAGSATAAGISVTGGLTWFLTRPEDDDDGDGPESIPEGDQSETGESTDEDEPTTDNSETGEGEDDREEGEPEDSGPSEEDTEIDRDEYEEHGERETTERSSDDVDVTADLEEHDDGSATVSGSVTNVIDTTIDVVDLEIELYNEAGEFLSVELVTVETLDSGASEDYQVAIPAGELQGDVENFEVAPNVYDLED